MVPPGNGAFSTPLLEPVSAFSAMPLTLYENRKQDMKRLALCLLIGFFLLPAGGCTPPEPEKPPATRVRSVTVTAVERRDLPIVVKAVGRLAPNRAVLVSTQVAGIVEAYYADVGQPVKAGGELVRLEADDYRLALNESRANLAAARAQLEAAQKSYERARQLLPENVITPEFYDRSEAEYKSSVAHVRQLTAMVDIAGRRLSKTRITAPFDAVVSQRMVELGQHLNPGSPLMHLADMHTMRVNIYLNEQDYVHLDASDPVTVMVEAFGEKSFPGKVDRIGVQADERTNTFRVEVLVDNPQDLLKVGLTARVEIVTDSIAGAIMVPQSCVLYRSDRTELFVASADNRADLRVVELGRVEAGRVNIVKGLAPGERLVTTGGQYLRDGDPIRIVQSPGDADR
jgi:RND family efflux transporter MFP subunit